MATKLEIDLELLKEIFKLLIYSKNYRPNFTLSLARSIKGLSNKMD